MSKSAHLYAVIMAGGIGSRFWPVSRTHLPKQFLDILGTGESLLQMTYQRFCDFVLPENIFIVTNDAYIPLVKNQLPNISSDQILGEPVGRNTAPCISYATFKIHAKDPHAVIVAAPSDHLILNAAKFNENVLCASVECLTENAIFTLGIQPTRPDTGYGYIQFIDNHPHSYCKVKVFTEKPDIVMAKNFLATGEFLWNSGIFIYPSHVMIDSIHRFLPEMYDLFYSIQETYFSEQEKENIREVYDKCKNISIDYGVMEKAERVYVIPSHFGWSDLGTWGSLYEQTPHDYYGNASAGKVFFFDSRDNYVSTKMPDKIMVIEGLEDYIVVDTPDVLLVCRKQNEQSIKEMVNQIKKENGDKYL